MVSTNAAKSNDTAADYLTAARQAGRECHAAARDYLSRGWSALALCPPDHTGVGKTHGQHCTSPGKAPFGPWKKFQTELPTLRDLDDKWRGNCLLNVGIALGPVSGLVRVDEDGEQGRQFLLKVSGGDLPDTLEMTSGGDGRGLLYTIPAGVGLRPTHHLGDKVHEGLSLLGQGSQTVLPPSRHASGRRYVWRPGHGPDEIKPAPAPAWLVTLMSASGGTSKNRMAALDDAEVIPEGKRGTVLASLAGSMRRRGMTAREIAAALLVVNERCEPPLEEDQVRGIAESIARYKPAEVPDGRGAPRQRHGHSTITFSLEVS
jgi:putative DNA primase/helicase